MVLASTFCHRFRAHTADWWPSWSEGIRWVRHYPPPFRRAWLSGYRLESAGSADGSALGHTLRRTTRPSHKNLWFCSRDSCRRNLWAPRSCPRPSITKMVCYNISYRKLLIFGHDTHQFSPVVCNYGKLSRLKGLFDSYCSNLCTHVVQDIAHYYAISYILRENYTTEKA